MQKIEYIDIKDLILWTENPRDPISARSKNQNVIQQALEDKHGKWRLAALAKAMGAYYDYSELPIVVYKNAVPIVYDGNRRVILAMLNLGLYPEFVVKFRIPECEESMPCCVADEKTALDSVWRKHAETGSWDQMSREIFQVRFRKQQKSVFLQLDEITNGVISQDKSLNQRFVSDEVLTNPRLKSIGVRVENNKIVSRHDEEETCTLIKEVFRLIKEKKITTRIGRKAPLSDLVNEECKSIVEKDKDKEYQGIDSKSVFLKSKPPVNSQGATPASTRLPQRVKSKDISLFGGKLSLRTGEPANLYRDILDLYDYYIANKSNLSDRFPALIRMALRLECELVAKCASSSGMEKLVRENFAKAKASLSQDEKTYLAQNQVSDSNIITLLQTGAHNYTGSYDLSQTIAMSLIVGGILKLHFGK